MSLKPEISIVTVGMNHLVFLKQLLISLFQRNTPKVTFELIYVDNCSTDGSLELIEEYYPQVKIIKNKIVKGFAENNNCGVRHSTGNYIAIINPDIVLLENSIDYLHDFLREKPEVGILVPKLLNQDLTVQCSVRRFIDLKTLALRILSNGKDNVKSKKVNNYLLKNFDTEVIQEVDWALGAAMFLRLDYYNYLKGFDEDYFLYVEDVDLCLRSWQNGKPVVYYPKSVMVHAHQKLSNQGFNHKKLLHLRSMLTFIIKHNLIFKTYSYMKFIGLLIILQL